MMKMEQFTEQEVKSWQAVAGGPVMSVLGKILQLILEEAQEAFEDPGCGIEVLKVNQGKVITVRRIEEMAQRIVDWDLEEPRGEDDEIENEGEVDVNL
jgi:hypothetical protein